MYVRIIAVKSVRIGRLVRIVKHPPRSRVRDSEFFLERAEFEFHRPRTRILVREMPVGLCDCVGLEKVAVLQTRLQSTRSRDVDATIHVDPGDVDASRTKVARE